MQAEALFDLKDLAKRDVKKAKRPRLQAVVEVEEENNAAGGKRVSWKFVLLLLIGIFLLVLFWKSFVLLRSNFLIERVLIKGEFHNEQAHAVESALSGHLSGDLFTVDLSAAHAAVVAIPWVADARLRRRWPDSVIVQIDERVPVARWQNNLYVDKHGAVFKQAYGVDTNELPMLHGPDEHSVEVLQQYQLISESLQQAAAELEVLQLDPRGTWAAHTADNVVIYMGDDDIISRLQRFVRIFNSSMNQNWSDMESVDLRHGNGFAVRLKQAAES